MDEAKINTEGVKVSHLLLLPPINTTNILTVLSRMLAVSNACDSWWEWVSACRREVADR